MLRNDSGSEVGLKAAGLVAQRVAPIVATDKGESVTNSVKVPRSGPRVEQVRREEASGKERRCAPCGQSEVRTPSYCTRSG